MKKSSIIANVTPVKAWEVTQGIDTPEGAYYHAPTNSIFISNIAGEGTAKDAKGWISRIDLDGNVLEEKWVQGLNAPKGMRTSNDYLWVSDIDTVRRIHLKTRKIKSFDAIEKSEHIFLNDIAIDPLSGDVYVSDTIGEKIYRISDEKVSVFASGNYLEGPNGLLVVDDKLLVGGWGQRKGNSWETSAHGNLYSIGLPRSDAPGERTVISKNKIGQLDGLEMAAVDEFIISDWMSGQISIVQTDSGTHTQILNTKQGTADISWIPSERLLIIPQMNESKIIAYKFAAVIAVVSKLSRSV